MSTATRTNRKTSRNGAKRKSKAKPQPATPMCRIMRLEDYCRKVYSEDLGYPNDKDRFSIDTDTGIITHHYTLKINNSREKMELGAVPKHLGFVYICLDRPWADDFWIGDPELCKQVDAITDKRHDLYTQVLELLAL